MKKILFPFILISYFGTGIFAQTRTVINVSGSVVNASSFTDKEVVISGKSDLHVSATYTPLTNSIIKLNSENSWVFFDNIRPQVVIDSILSNIYVNDAVAVNKSNARVSIYKHGTVVMPHASTIQPLEVFTEQNYGGNSQKYSLSVYNDSLITFDNKIRSFKLKRGYMATLANNSDGSGYSRVFIADEADLEIPVLSKYLDKTVSFIRVFNWEWVTKKGWCQTGWMSGAGVLTNTNRMNGTWYYTWSVDQNTQPNEEYALIKQKQYWPGASEINAKQNVTHLLGYNEPDHTEQSNITVDQAIASWPELQKSGLRLGSPAVTNFSWLYDFMTKAKARNYRVDYVAIHAYWGGLTPTQWYNDLKYIHEQTGRPLWITEWNNGADWTTETWPSAYGDALTKQKNELKAILNVLDTAHFVERYSIYNWVGYKRMLISDDAWITPAGELYRDNKSSVAFQRRNEVIPTYAFSSKTASLALSIPADKSGVTLSWTGGDQEFATDVVIERKLNDGEYAEIYRSSQAAITSYNAPHDFTAGGKYSYRVRILLNDGTEAVSNEQYFNITTGTEFQYGKVGISNVDWNPVYFGNAFAGIPVAIFGAPTNNNTTCLLSPRVRSASNKMFNFQLAPWAYQSVTSLSKEESVPYFLLKSGTYDFGGLKAIAARTTATPAWTTITFPTAFDSIPVVLATQASVNSTNATTVRIKNVTKTGFDVKLQKESKISTALTSEMFSYLAVQQGVGHLDGKKLWVGSTPDNAVGNAITQYAKITYPETVENPVFIAHMQTCNDDTVTSTLRCRSVLNTEARVFKQREVSLGYTASATEKAGWMLISGDIPSGIDNINASKSGIYPNPVKETIFFNTELPEGTRVDIYTVYGALVTSKQITKKSIGVSELIPGCYVLKISNKCISKFIKL